MKSHEYAVMLREQATYLLSKPEFEMPGSSMLKYHWFMFSKEPFLAAVRALGSGEKIIGKEYVDFQPTNAPFFLRIERNHVCRKVKEAEYECDPFLSQMELLEVGK